MGEGMPAELEALIEACQTRRMKALSIKQPYPHHIFYDGKDVENRDWPTRGRGWVIVHAGVSKTELSTVAEASYPRGGIVGFMKITDCVEEMDSQWFFGRYGFVIGAAFPIAPVPCKGQLGFFRPPDEALDAVAAHLLAQKGGA